MIYDSVKVVESQRVPGVSYSIARMSFGRRIELMRKVRELAARIEFLEAGQDAASKMDAGLLRVEIERLYVEWGLRSVAGLTLDGAEATPVSLMESGPEELFREALEAVKTETGLTESERKN